LKTRSASKALTPKGQQANTCAKRRPKRKGKRGEGGSITAEVCADRNRCARVTIRGKRRSTTVAVFVFGALAGVTGTAYALTRR